NGLQYFSNRNITVKPANAVAGNPVTVRYYFTDAEVNELRAASGCVDCKPPVDYTRLNVTKYADPDRAIEDGSITNNVNGTWSSVLNAGITFVPYDAGYYADFTVTDFSEFYITDGNYDIALPAKWVRFDAAKEGSNNARLVWETANESNVLHYQPQVMMPGGRFESIGQVAAQNALSATYSFADQRPGKSGTLLYRIQQTDKDGQVSYSETRSLRFGNSSMRINTYPNPASNHVMVQMDAEKPLLLHWRITDVAGRTTLQGQWQMANAVEKWRINIQSLPVGIYQLAIEWNNEKLVQKLVKVKE
ncbi:MAG TPA: T9SS type A sorting domain-containing protein, partial [Phnomibacter sp.]|nr:T9SS type A sorting domain-containing protein [Phnomibacter sp.]